jgi:putative flippase GtrA
MRRQMVRYCTAGIFVMVTDYILYMLGLGMFEMSVTEAKAASYVVATCLSYVLNKYWTFESRQLCPREAAAFFSLYFVTWLVNLSANLFFYKHLINLHLAWALAFTLSTLLNFAGQRLWVFRAPSR